jgi:peptidoglycan/xylan/chitin deacetylase (PgdA/CDA1 family)
MNSPAFPVTVLNYHRIVPDREVVGFYDLPISSFERQVRLVAERKVGAVDGLIATADGRRVCFTFDDGTADHFEAAAILAAHGLEGVFFVVSNWVGAEGHLTASQIANMARAGHRIGSHSLSHRQLPSVPANEMRRELEQSKRVLEALSGRAVDWFAPPGGVYDEASLAMASTAGYRVFRTMEWGYAQAPLGGRVPCLPILRNYNMQTFERLLDGKASLWRYTFKTWLKRIVPEVLYQRLRSAGMTALDRVTR